MSRASWLPSGLDVSIPRVLLLSLVCVVLLTVVILGLVSSTVFGLYNPTWEGTSDFREQIDEEGSVDIEVVSETSEYETLEANGTVAFVIAPDEEYSPEAAAQIRGFLERGGTLVVFENFGSTGNALLGDIGAESRFDGQLVRDEQEHFQGPEMPVATTIENHTLTAGVERLTLNYATAVEPGNATVLVRTSEFAYLTTETESDLDEDDELAAYPVAATEAVGDGELLVVGDPSITINAMYQEPDNAVFLQNIYSDADRVAFDISHQGGVPPLTSAVLVFRGSAAAQVVVGGLVVVLLAIVSRGWLSEPWRRIEDADRWQLLRRRLGYHSPAESPILTTDERARYLRAQHPEWEDERIERVITAFKHTSEKDDKRK